MTFNSLAFAVFLPIVLCHLYLAVTRDRRWTVIACASVAFVVIGQPAGIVFLGIATIVAYVATLRMAHVTRRSVRRAILAAGVVLLIGQLVASSLWDVRVTLGLSFYTLRLLSYLFDVYQGRTAPEREFGVLVAYSAFFPGVWRSVYRAATLIPQLRNPRPFIETTATRGLKRFAWGLAKKLIVADQLAMFVNPVFASPTAYNFGISLSVAAVFFAFQVYYDFSSDRTWP